MTRLEFHPDRPADATEVGLWGFWLGVSCPRCGGRLDAVATGTAGLGTRAVVSCEPCRRHWVIAVTLAEVTAELGRPLAVPGHAHGTRSHYLAGCRCAECRAADAAYKREYRRRRHGAVA